MIAFTTSLVGISRWVGSGRRRRLRDVRGDLRIERGHGSCDRLDHDAGDGEHGYPRRFGVGVISTSGALGILVPPSIILVLYGVSTNTSIGALFMAGIVPASCWR